VTADDVNEAMVAACQRLSALPKVTPRAWRREMDAAQELYLQLDEEERAHVDLEPLSMMDPAKRR
jgi:hypothetical protein